MFAARTPSAARYRVTLYGSLAATGRGHHTDKAISRGLAPRRVDILWRPDIVKPFHTNGMFFEAFATEEATEPFDTWLVYSIGGGYLATEEGVVPLGITPEGEVYPHNTMKDIMEHIDKEGLSFWEYVEQCEDESLWPYLEEMWRQMQQTIEEGLQDDVFRFDCRLPFIGVPVRDRHLRNLEAHAGFRARRRDQMVPRPRTSERAALHGDDAGTLCAVSVL
jgi:L-serine dehydratase